MTIHVKNCLDCPFSEHDSDEYEYWCARGAWSKEGLGGFDMIPKEIPDNCPLKEDRITIELLTN